jgi:hypothetical protein
MYPSRYLHSDNYYLQIITRLIKFVGANYSDKEIVAAFNADGILAPSGKPFTVEKVRQMLTRLRHHKDYPNKLHNMLCQFVFEGRLTAPETYPLFQTRQQGM